MAALTKIQLAQIRKDIESKTQTVGSQDKPTLNTAIQAMETWWAANKSDAIAQLGSYSTGDKGIIYHSWARFKLSQ